MFAGNHSLTIPLKSAFVWSPSQFRHQTVILDEYAVAVEFVVKGRAGPLSRS